MGMRLTKQSNYSTHTHCRSYRSIGDEAFMSAFETATLGYEEWTHEVQNLPLCALLCGNVIPRIW